MLVFCQSANTLLGGRCRPARVGGHHLGAGSGTGFETLETENPLVGELSVGDEEGALTIERE